MSELIKVSGSRFLVENTYSISAAFGSFGKKKSALPEYSCLVMSPTQEYRLVNSDDPDEKSSTRRRPEESADEETLPKFQFNAKVSKEGISVLSKFTCVNPHHLKAGMVHKLHNFSHGLE